MTEFSSRASLAVGAVVPMSRAVCEEDVRRMADFAGNLGGRYRGEERNAITGN
jgi:hypothetical protein